MSNNIMTFDLEGDGLKAEVNQKLFPDGNHQDPNTRLWCATLTYKEYNKLITETYVAKLPASYRLVKDAVYNNSIHDKATKVPKKVIVKDEWLNGCEYEQHIYELNNEWELIKTVIHHLINADYMGYKIYCKGYGAEYNYDYLALLNSFHRLKADRDLDEVNTIRDELIELRHALINAITEFPIINNLWRKTPGQVKSGTPNQEAIRWGVLHNVVDSIQLYNLLEKQIIIKNRLQSIQKDFK